MDNANPSRRKVLKAAAGITTAAPAATEVTDTVSAVQDAVAIELEAYYGDTGSRSKNKQIRDEFLEVIRTKLAPQLERLDIALTASAAGGFSGDFNLFKFAKDSGSGKKIHVLVREEAEFGPNTPNELGDGEDAHVNLYYGEDTYEDEETRTMLHIHEVLHAFIEPTNPDTNFPCPRNPNDGVADHQCGSIFPAPANRPEELMATPLVGTYDGWQLRELCENRTNADWDDGDNLAHTIALSDCTKEAIDNFVTAKFVSEDECNCNYNEICCEGPDGSKFCTENMFCPQGATFSNEQ